MKKTVTKAFLLFSFWFISLCIAVPAKASVAPPVQPTEKVAQMDKKELRQRIKTFRQTHRAELKGMNSKARKAYIADGIAATQILPNAWLPVGLVLIVVGAIMALFGGIIAWIGGGVALVGLAFLIVWLIKAVNSPY